MQQYNIERAIDGIENGIPIDRSLSSKNIFISPGLCRADPSNPLGNRGIGWYDQNTLKRMIESGEIDDGSKTPYDDRKMRFHAAVYTKDESEIGAPLSLEIQLGHSNFLEHQERNSRSPEEISRLVGLGFEKFNDGYAFFGRCPGVTGIIKTSDKKIVVGQRQVNRDKYEELLQGPAGHVDFRENPYDVDLKEDMLRELVEETGIKFGEVNGLEFLGIYSDPGVAGDDLDITYLIDTKVPSTYFTGTLWKERVKEQEHSRFIAVSNYDLLQRLIYDGDFNGENFDIIFSTRGPLAQIKPEDFN